MNKILKIFAFVISGLFVILIAVVAYISIALPRVDAAPELTVDLNAEQVEKGRYLATHVMMCVDCHSQRDFSIFAAPPHPGTELAGGEIFDQTLGLPGVFISPNITPAGIGDWTDGELFRLITTGVKKDGNPIFPIMPYHNFGKMDEEDIKAVIAYIRSVPPIETNHPKSKADFPMNLIMRTIPKNAAFEKKPQPDDVIEYGRYMVNAAACNECHTDFRDGKFVGEYLAGGREMMFPDGAVVRSANLTPDETGLKSWTKEDFIQKFKSFSSTTVTLAKVQPGEFQTIMPWLMYADMTEEDLGAIYTYLQSLKPVKNKVERYTPAP
ncbi:c-type cytochrome [Litoribacter ruber]|uniref:c-type cytochrome n=1 Tax=Litoribacter ruber TaxID=702568 RepID=UPI001BDB0382|nr:cytochrome c [Litoribacter ruber]MBT0811030.1 c-type cytochrome [Litoribacter ruber]